MHGALVAGCRSVLSNASNNATTANHELKRHTKDALMMRENRLQKPRSVLVGMRRTSLSTAIGRMEQGHYIMDLLACVYIYIYGSC